jgi:hypothetical protein
VGEGREEVVGKEDTGEVARGWPWNNPRVKTWLYTTALTAFTISKDLRPPMWYCRCTILVIYSVISQVS